MVKHKDRVVKEFYQVRPHKGEIGLELEAEYSRVPDLPDPMPAPWAIKADNSLRGEYPCEFLTNRSIFVETRPRQFSLEKSLKTLLDTMKVDGLMEDSSRTSFHVHVNCQEMTLRQVEIAIACYIAVEIPLLQICGEQRETNCYCLSVKEAEGFFDKCSRVLREQPEYNGLNDFWRYSALNVDSLPKLGSLEFRSMRGEPDLKLLTSWATACRDVVKNSTQYRSLEEVSEAVKDPKGLVASLFTKEFAQEIYETAFWEDSIINSLNLLFDFELALKERMKPKAAPKGRIPKYHIRHFDDVGYPVEEDF